MRKIIGFTLAAILIFVYCFTAFGINIDGNDCGTEWDGATAYKLFSGESNSSVNFGTVKVKFAPEEYAVYLCFTFLDPCLEKGNDLAGISLSVENSPSYVLTMANSPSAADVDNYEVSGAMYIDENNGGTCEVRVGIKHGVPKELSCSVRFLDYEGVPSNVYNFTLVNESYTETTQMYIAPTADNSDPVYNPDLLTTISPGTTKPKKTNTEKTTKEKITTERTTKEKTTKATTTKKKTTTKAEKTTRAETKTKKETQNQTVYVYEKEIIISQVVVTIPVSVTESSTTQNDTTVETTQPTQINISAGSKYKKIAGVIGAVAFIAVAAWGTASAKKKESVDKQS